MLTSASCAKKDPVIALLGVGCTESTGTGSRVEKAVLSTKVHPDFRPTDWDGRPKSDYDVAVVKLRTPVSSN